MNYHYLRLVWLFFLPSWVYSDYCEYPLLDSSSLTASSELVTREADKARLYDPLVLSVYECRSWCDVNKEGGGGILCCGIISQPLIQ
ncbi:hypothetical protein Hamer_G012254 [Homarus americanus]|uniref:Secreted protein n=1 Tax=Homarus americanus TaxID=6706 RepID=A0A8J5N0H8_HOMAM|nr:hypothetical protein Hamer_G012254 [Homarus americanus]